VVPGLISGHGKAGHQVQVRDQDNDVLCTTDVNSYGTWGCTTATLIAPGFTLGLWEKDQALGVNATMPGTRLGITTPAPNTLNPAAPVTITGTGTAGHDLTLTLHHPTGTGKPAYTTSLPVTAASTWSYTLPTGTLLPGTTYSLTVADKSIYDHRSISFTTTGTPPLTTPTPPFEAKHEAETTGTGGTTYTMPNGQKARKYVTDEEATFPVTVPTTGDYTLTITYNATTRGNNTLITIYPNNSTPGSRRTTISNTTTKTTLTLTLNKGTNTITLVPPPGTTLPDLDHITLTK
jgi:hypothetical protein